jgi:hypothetical protein
MAGEVAGVVSDLAQAAVQATPGVFDKCAGMDGLVLAGSGRCW